jgi:hypothetical protein
MMATSSGTRRLERWIAAVQWTTNVGDAPMAQTHQMQNRFGAGRLVVPNDLADAVVQPVAVDCH